MNSNMTCRVEINGRRRKRNHKDIHGIHRVLMTSSYIVMKLNKVKMINGHKLPIMRNMHHSELCGHYKFHGAKIIMSKEKIKI